MKPALKIGWSEVDITPPQQPVVIVGQFPARISEGVKDPLQATVLVLESGEESVIFVTCDLVAIPDELRDSLRDRLGEAINAEKVVINATHTHTGPEVRGQGKRIKNSGAARGKHDPILRFSSFP